MYKIMFVVGLTLALLFLLISIVLFFKNNVAKLIGDITGWNAKKAIKAIQEKNDMRKPVEESKVSQQEYVTSSLPTVDTTVESTTLLSNTQVGVEMNQEQMQSTEVDYMAQNIFEVEDEMMVFASDAGGETEECMYESDVTTLLAEEATTLLAEENTTLLTGEEATTLLVDEEATTLLVGEETTLLTDEEATTLLVGEETTLLADEEATTLLVGEETALLANEDATTLLAKG